MQLPNDEQVLQYIESVPGLREQWNIPSAKRMTMIAFVIMNACLLAVVIGAFVYFVTGAPGITGKNVSGLVIVLVLAYVVSVIRIFQLRSERRELPAFRKTLASALTGDPETDGAAQRQVEADFKWESMRYQYVCRMIGIAGLVVIGINEYQVGIDDLGRLLLFDGCILIFLMGAFWVNYAFKADLLEVELEERCRATIAWQMQHPNADQAAALRDAGIIVDSQVEDVDDADAGAPSPDGGARKHLPSHSADDDPSFDD